MKLYIARHGQTDWNLKHKSQGRTDIPLNATGVQQAEELREKLRDYDFGVCYASPLKRAAETARIAVDGRCEIIFDGDLEERSFGELEGTDPAEWEGDDLDLKANLSDHGVEPIKAVFERSRRVLERIKAENPVDARVLVVAHGTLLKTLHFNIIGYDEETDLRSFHLGNGEVVEYEV